MMIRCIMYGTGGVKSSKNLLRFADKHAALDRAVIGVFL
jgi:hypothetical protein